jgi:hypothetical protein
MIFVPTFRIGTTKSTVRVFPTGRFQLLSYNFYRLHVPLSAEKKLSNKKLAKVFFIPLVIGIDLQGERSYTLETNIRPVDRPTSIP